MTATEEKYHNAYILEEVPKSSLGCSCSNFKKKRSGNSDYYSKKTDHRVGFFIIALPIYISFPINGPTMEKKVLQCCIAVPQHGGQKCDK